MEKQLIFDLNLYSNANLNYKKKIKNYLELIMEEEMDKAGLDYMIQQAIKEVIAEKIKNGLIDISVVKNYLKKEEPESDSVKNDTKK
jgi:hypothetical protein